MPLPTNKVRDRKTGKVRAVDLEKSRSARKAAVKRKGKPLPAAQKAKIGKAVTKVIRSGRTSTGRKSLLPTKTIKA